MLSGLLAMPCESTCCCVCWSRHPSLPDVVLSWQPWKTFYPALPINGTGEDLRALMSNASDAEKPNGESGAAWGGGVLPAAAPRGGCPSDDDDVGVCSQPSARRTGRKRAAELARALLTHQLVPESNHRLVFNEHLSWKAGNPLVSCFAP